MDPRADGPAPIPQAELRVDELLLRPWSDSDADAVWRAC